MATVTVDDKAVRDVMEGLRKSGVDPKPVLQMYGGYMKGIAGRSIDRQKSPATGAAFPGLGPMVRRLRGSGKRLYDTGRLVKSWMAAPIRVTRGRVRVVNSYPPAALHQFGGTVRPKSARMLAIPLTKQAKRAGSARRWWANSEKKGLKPFTFTSKAGNVCIGVSKKKARRGAAGFSKYGPAELETHFLLLQSVSIPATPYLGFGREEKAKFSEMVTTYLTRVAREKGAR